MEQWSAVLFFAVMIILIYIEIRHRNQIRQQARADFRSLIMGTQGVNYTPLHQARGHFLTWVCSQPNTYTLCANSDVLAVLYFDENGSLVGARSADGQWAVERGRLFSLDSSLGQVYSQMDVARMRFLSHSIEFPTGRVFRYKSESARMIGPKVKWVIFDVSRAPLIFMEEESRTVRIEHRAYSMPELPLLVLLGGYLMIFSADYVDDSDSD